MAVSKEDRELIVAVSRDLIADVAPEERVIFGPLSAAYLQGRRLSTTAKDDMLGTGLGEVVTPLTPIALSVVGEVLVYLRSELARTAAKEAAGAIDEVVRGLFRRFHRSDRAVAVPGLTGPQLTEVRRMAFETARAAGINERRARLLADAIIGCLVVSA